MIELPVPVAVLTLRSDDVEYFNKTMRDAGHPVRCKGFAALDKLEEALANDHPDLLIFFADGHPASVHEVARVGQLRAPLTRLIVIAATSDEAAIAEALKAGAQDLVSSGQRERIRIVCERELKAVRYERAANESAHLARHYKEQLNAFICRSTDAIAQVQEGIIVEANQAWADIFSGSEIDGALGPLMDFFPDGSRATLKGALTALNRGRFDGKPLLIEASNGNGAAVPIELELHASSHDGEPATKLSIRRKPPNASELDAAAESRAHEILKTDPVTGFLQRHNFIEILSDKLAQCTGNGARSLVIVRPDQFAEIERTLGPIASEELLARLAEVLGRLIDTTDIAGRFGGTVFAFVIERERFRDVQAWGQKVVREIADHMFEVAERSLSLTCSIGIAEIGQGTDLAEDLIRSAGDANKRARQQGGNQVVVKETSDESTLIKRADQLWVWQIKSALVENRFRLVHLSVSSLSGRSVRIYDTVIRMIDGQGDEIPASEFLGTAARNKLLRPIDRWVINATLAFCAREACDLVFVKLSNESILDPTLPSWLSEQLAQSGINPNRLCLQISEEDATHYQKQTNAMASMLQRIGIRVAIENFGTGRGSQRVLSQFPLDFVKFDGSLIRQVAEDHSAQETLRALIAHAQQNDVETIASHVENANTMAVLFQLGVTYMQGHYLHEPEVVLEEAI